MTELLSGTVDHPHKQVLLLEHNEEFVALFKPPIPVGRMLEATVATHAITAIKYARNAPKDYDHETMMGLNDRRSQKQQKAIASVSYNMEPMKSTMLTSQQLFLDAMQKTVQALHDYELVPEGLHRIETANGVPRAVPISGGVV